MNLLTCVLSFSKHNYPLSSEKGQATPMIFVVQFIKLGLFGVEFMDTLGRIGATAGYTW